MEKEEMDHAFLVLKASNILTFSLCQFTLHGHSKMLIAIGKGHKIYIFNIVCYFSNKKIFHYILTKVSIKRTSFC